MGRFYSYEEITTRELTLVKDIQWLAGRIKKLPAFVDGTAVICGSVSWGACSWRSDIDVAHFSTLDYPHIQSEVESVIDDYQVRTGHKYIPPRVDVITIGAEPEKRASQDFSISAGCVSGAVDAENCTTDHIFIETAIHFSDHIGSIADRKGLSWQSFLQKYLKGIHGTGEQRREFIRSYVQRFSEQWAQQPLHSLNLPADGSLNEKQLQLIAKTENYPINLIRRILGEMGQYPHPDKPADVRQAFSLLTTPWSKYLLDQFQPFFDIDQQYEQLVASCKKSKNQIPAEEYFKQLRILFSDLPFKGIQNAVWEYLEN